MAVITPLPPSYTSTRTELQHIAVHIVARRRHQLSGRFGLRPGAGSIVSPLAGPDDEIVRISDVGLVVERREASGTRTAIAPWEGATLRGLASHVGADLDAQFSVGHDTPAVGDRDVALAIDPAAVAAVATWFTYGQRVLDRVLLAVTERGPTVPQIWPEHFDLGCDVAGGSSRVNLGASPGDGYLQEPYLYVGPWGVERTGDEAFWNAPFGATRAYEQLLAAADPVAAGVEFFLEGLARVP